MPTPGSNGADGRDKQIMFTPLPATYDHPAQFQNEVIFTDTGGQVRTDKDMHVNAILRVLGNVRVDGSTTVGDIACLARMPEVMGLPQPKQLISAGSPIVYDQKMEYNGNAYHFNEGMICTSAHEFVVKGDLFVEGNLSCRELVVSGSVSFWGGFSGMIVVKSHLQRNNHRDVLRP